MGTYEPKKLLNLWQQEKIFAEAAIGHILQNLVNLQKDLSHQKQNLNRLQKRLPPVQKSNPEKP